jgi:coenzyme F420-reducing hydrogenase delta subunit/ferredoxin
MYEPKIIAYLCTWCSYTGADTAGIARLKSPANIRAVRVPCSGRVSPELIMRTFDQGADGVLVLGCHLGECHYESGNHRTAKRLPVLKALLQFAGLEPERLRLDWVSASEGERFSRIVTEFCDEVRQLGPVRWKVNGEQYRAGGKRKLTQPTYQPARMSRTIYEQQTSVLRQTARELLSSQQVDCVIGYEEDQRGRTRPTFVYLPEDSDRLVWNQDCTHNLTGYLSQKLHQSGNQNSSREKPAVAVVVKPCDSKSINVQLAEKAYERQQVHIIGMTCAGIREQPRSNGKLQVAQEPRLQPRCQDCTERTPVVYDTLIGEPPKDIPDGKGISQRALKITQLQAMSPAERMEVWLGEFDRCIRCYACRQACPMCDCPTCLYERDDSLWVGAAHGWDGVGLNEKRAFHLGRAYHLAGRCIGCDECERACPMGIPISYLNQMLAQEMESLYHHRAGSSQAPTPFVTILSGEEGLK